MELFLFLFWSLQTKHFRQDGPSLVLTCAFHRCNSKLPSVELVQKKENAKTIWKRRSKATFNTNWTVSYIPSRRSCKSIMSWKNNSCKFNLDNILHCSNAYLTHRDLIKICWTCHIFLAELHQNGIQREICNYFHPLDDLLFGDMRSGNHQHNLAIRQIYQQSIFGHHSSRLVPLPVPR